jgi:methylthioribulose-1-phosphate dehydratase
MKPDYNTAVEQIISAGQFLAKQGWAPATAGNYSMRLDDGRIAMTVSGFEKGELTPDAIMTVDAEGKPLDNRRPSAEMLLHIGIYAASPETNAILHTHSKGATVFTKRHKDLKAIRLADYELLKIFPHIDTHDTYVDLPIFDNTQDMKALRADVDPVLANGIPAYLIRGHGLYGWGRTMAEARSVVEATEFMLACELELRSVA